MVLAVVSGVRAEGIMAMGPIDIRWPEIPAHPLNWLTPRTGTRQARRMAYAEIYADR
jgi:hypothetical protein